MKRIILSLVLVAAMLSCAKEQDAIQTPATDGSERVYASAADFVCGNEPTKTVITQEGAAAPKFAWKEGDVIGIIPMNNETVQSNYKISEISSDPKEAMFDGGVWALKEGKEYAAYYPFSEQIARSGDNLEFSFLNQTQAANNSLAHLGAYDYMYAGSVIPAAGLATFQFKHLISLVRLRLTVPITDTFTSVLLESNNAWFASKASLKLSDGTATGSDYLKNYTLHLNNIGVSSGNVLTLWIAVLPTDALKDNKLAITLSSATDNMTGEISIPDGFKAGRAYSYSCVLEYAGVNAESIDLGLSVKWASCNLGANTPEEYGDYYAWGETETKSKAYTSGTYKFYKLETDYVGGVYVQYKGYTKYIPQSKADIYGFRGFYDNKTVLDPEDDAANVKLGDKWRMPTIAEYEELIDNCQCDWVTYKGVPGRKFTSKKTGYTDKWIFLPAAGYTGNGNYYSVASAGHYQSSSLRPDFPFATYPLCFHSNNMSTSDSEDRFFGLSVRPVSE